MLYIYIIYNNEIYICMYNTYMFIYIYIYYIHFDKYIFIYVSIFIYTRIYIYIYIYIFTYIYIHVYIYIHIYTHTHTQHTYIYIYIYIVKWRLYMCIYIYLHSKLFKRYKKALENRANIIINFENTKTFTRFNNYQASKYVFSARWLQQYVKLRTLEKYMMALNIHTGWNDKIVALEKTTWFHFRLMKTGFLFFMCYRPSTSWPVVY